MLGPAEELKFAPALLELARMSSGSSGFSISEGLRVILWAQPGQLLLLWKTKPSRLRRRRHNYGDNRYTDTVHMIKGYHLNGWSKFMVRNEDVSSHVSAKSTQGLLEMPEPALPVTAGHSFDRRMRKYVQMPLVQLESTSLVVQYSKACCRKHLNNLYHWISSEYRSGNQLFWSLVPSKWPEDQSLCFV